MSPPAATAAASTWPRRALHLILALNLALALGSAGLWFIAARQDLLWRADFSAFYTGWAMVLAGDGAKLYDLSAQATAQRVVLDGRSFADNLLPYVNPPHVTLPFVPLALFTLPAAYGVWAVVQVALTIVATKLLIELEVHPSRTVGFHYGAAFLAFPPLAGTLLRGTFSLLILVSILYLYRSLQQGKDRPAGIWVALITLKPQLALAPGALLVGARRWQALGSFTLSILILAAITTLVLGWEIWLAYARTLAEVNSFFGRNGINPAQMPNLRGGLTRLLGNEQWMLINALSTATLALGACAMLWLWRGPWHPQSTTTALRLALALTLGLLVSPHLYSHDALLLALPIALLAAHVRKQPQRSYRAGVLLLTPTAFLLGETIIGPTLQMVVMVGVALWIGAELWHTSTGR